MRRILVSNMVTLDGYFTGPSSTEDWQIDWHMVSDDFFKYADELSASADMHLYGRVTYEGMKSYWTSDDAVTNDAVVAEQMNATPKLVVSTTLDTVDWGKWNNATLLKGNVGEEIAKLKQQPGKDIVIFGSGKLVSSLTQLGLIDEYWLFTVPLILGGGKPLFAGITAPIKLKVVRNAVLSTGVVMTAYAPDKG